MNIAKLKGLMAEHGETREDIAKILNVSNSTAKNRLLGKSKFTFDEVKILSQHYKVDINIFLLNK